MCTDLGWVRVDGRQVAPDALATTYFDTEPVRQMAAVPFWSQGELCWGVKDPLSVDMVNLSLFTEHPLVMGLVEPDSWPNLLEKLVSCRDGGAFNALAEKGLESSALAADASMWPYCHLVLAEAQGRGCSDIHLVSEAQRGVVRFRLDGVMHKYASISLPMMRALIGVLKHAAAMDVTELRLPQGGRVSFCPQLRRIIADHEQSSLGIRLNTLPGVYGESMLLRLLRHQPLSLDVLGLMPSQRQCLVAAVQQSQGLVVLCGPTGCGKSSTLHALLMQCDRANKHVVTLEDPVEAMLDGVHQVPMRSELGLDFSDVLPQVLRSDPDILMVGEVRDSKTARLVLSAAQTGHLVLTTVHGASVVSALHRLQQLVGCSMATLLHSVNVLVEQRLLRKVCDHCQGSGCSSCCDGYRGRVGVFGCYSHQDLVSLSQDAGHLGSPALLAAARHYVNQGLTTEAEIARVLSGGGPA